MDQALEYIGADTPILLSFDIDALDPASYGSTGTPVSDGLTLRQGQIICDRVQKAGTLVAMDLVRNSPNPLLHSPSPSPPPPTAGSYQQHSNGV